jgi:hypothetical protein
VLPEPWEITVSYTGCFPLISVRVGLTWDAQPEHGSSRSGESESDLEGDNMDHHEIYCPIAADPIYKPSSEFESDGRQKVFLVWQGETFANQTEEEIARAAEAEIA